MTLSEVKVQFQVWVNFWQLKTPLKWWKMLFISPEKLVLFIRYLFSFQSFLIMSGNGLIKLSTWKLIITILILPNISKSKGNETTKFDHLRSQHFFSCDQKILFVYIKLWKNHIWIYISNFMIFVVEITRYEEYRQYGVTPHFKIYCKNIDEKQLTFDWKK